MELNATIFVQVGHFFCAYIILDRVLLRPALARIQADERKSALVERDIAESQERVAARVRYNEQDWYILQKRLRAECPEVQIGQHGKLPIDLSSGALAQPTVAQIQVIAAAQRQALKGALRSLLTPPKREKL